MTLFSYHKTGLAAILLQRLILFAILFFGVVSCLSAGATTPTETIDGADAETPTEKTVTLLVNPSASWQFPVVALYQSLSSREWKQERWDHTELTFNFSGDEDIKLLVFYTTKAGKLEPFLFSSTKLYEKRISWDTEGQNIKLEQFQDDSKPPKITLVLVKERLIKPTDGSQAQIVVTVKNRDENVIHGATVKVDIDDKNKALINDYSSDTDSIGEAKIGIHETPFQSCWSKWCDSYYNIRVTCSHPNYKNEALSKKITYPKDIDKEPQIPQYRATCTMSTPKKPSIVRFKIKEAEGDNLPIENAQVKVTTQKQEDYADTNKEGVAIIPLHKPTRQTRIRVNKKGFNKFAGTLQKISGLQTEFIDVQPIKLSLPVDKFLLSLQLVDSGDKTPINLSTVKNISVERDKGKPIPQNKIELNNYGYITLPYFSLLTTQNRNEQIKIIVTEPDYNRKEVTISLNDPEWKSTGTREWFRELQIPLRQKGTGLLVIINPAKNWSRYNLTRNIVRTQLAKLLNSSSTYSQVGIGVLGGEMEMLIGSTTELVETRRSILRQLRRGVAIHGKARPEKIVEILTKHEEKLYKASQWHVIILIPHDPFADSPDETTLEKMTKLLIKHNIELSIIEDGELKGSDFYKQLAQWQQKQSTKQQYFKHLPVVSKEDLQQHITRLIVNVAE